MFLSRKEAKTLGLKQYFTGQPCPKGHIEYRATRSGTCVECGREAVARWTKVNKDRVNECQRHRRVNNPISREKYLTAQKKHQKENPGYWCAAAAKRKACKLQRTPAWADLKTIQTIYEECERRNQATGIKHVVDHVIPLQGERVSGLHVAENLQVITEQENLKKSNKLVC